MLASDRMNLRRIVALAVLGMSVVTAAQCAGRRVSDGAVAEATAQVRGRVFDQYGASIPDATMWFQPVDPGSGLPEFHAVADGRGRFDFEAVRTGTYRVTCRASGYETTVSIEEVRLGVQNEVTLIMRAAKSKG